MAGVTNAEILAAIQASGMDEAWRHAVDMQLQAIRVAQEAQTRATEAGFSKEAKRDSCPFRDDIVSSSNNKARLKSVEEALAELKLNLAKSGMLSGAAGGGTVTAIGAVAFALGKAAGWW